MNNQVSSNEPLNIGKSVGKHAVHRIQNIFKFEPSYSIDPKLFENLWDETIVSGITKEIGRPFSQVFNLVQVGTIFWPPTNGSSWIELGQFFLTKAPISIQREPNFCSFGCLYLRQPTWAKSFSLGKLYEWRHRIVREDDNNKSLKYSQIFILQLFKCEQQQRNWKQWQKRKSKQISSWKPTRRET